MSDPHSWLKLIHIVSATVLFGTGIGTAFQMWMAHRTGDVRAIAAVAGNVVIADYLFTTPAVIVQPISGIALIWIVAPVRGLVVGPDVPSRRISPVAADLNATPEKKACIP